MAVFHLKLHFALSGTKL